MEKPRISASEAGCGVEVIMRVAGRDEFPRDRAEGRRRKYLLLHAPQSGVCEAKNLRRLRSQALKRLIANSLLVILIASLLAPLTFVSSK